MRPSQVNGGKGHADDEFDDCVPWLAMRVEDSRSHSYQQDCFRSNCYPPQGRSNAKEELLSERFGFSRVRKGSGPNMKFFSHLVGNYSACWGPLSISWQATFLASCCTNSSHAGKLSALEASNQNAEHSYYWKSYRTRRKALFGFAEPQRVRRCREPKASAPVNL